DELPRSARWLAACVRLVTFESRLAKIMQRPRPGLKWNLFDLDIVRQMGIGAGAVDTVRVYRHLDDSGRRAETLFSGGRPEVQSAVRPMRSRTRRICAPLRILCERRHNHSQHDREDESNMQFHTDLRHSREPSMNARSPSWNPSIFSQLYRP